MREAIKDLAPSGVLGSPFVRLVAAVGSRPRRPFAVKLSRKDGTWTDSGRISVLPSRVFISLAARE